MLPRPPPLSRTAALYLDFDGTLTGLAQRPEAVEVPGELRDLIAALCRRQAGALAILSGRRLADLDALLDPLRLPAAGVHGAELRATAEAPVERVSSGRWVDLRALAEQLGERFASDPRVIVEDKDAAVALHFRQAPERAAECLQVLRQLARRHHLDVLVGRMVVETRLPGADKGRALKRLAVQPDFAGRMPVCVGDDRTDEDAMAAASELGGYGIRVGAGASRARYRLRGVAEVHAWLRDSLRDGNPA